MWIRYGLGQASSLAFTLVRMIPLVLANRFGRVPIPAAASHGVVISVTSHGPRLKHAHIALESLARGNVPAPIVLWLDREDYEAPWPPALQRLVNRGLQVRCSDGAYGPHTKYWPMFHQATGPVVTADDDIIYPEWFLERLLVAGQLRPDCVVAHRAHETSIRNGQLAPYRKWTPVTTTDASARHFATGVSGVLYPPSFIAYALAHGANFMAAAPRADDVWLHLLALRSGHKVRQVSDTPRNFAVVPASQTHALSVRNTLFGGNDAQIARVYTQEDVATLSG